MKISFDKQDLNDETPKRYWSHARCWFRFGENRHRRDRFNTVELSWTMPPSHAGYEIGFGGENDVVSFTIWIPLLATIWLSFDHALPRNAIEWEFERGNDRQIGFYFFERALWYKVWVGGMASWSRSYSWCKWWRQGSIHFDDLLLGKHRYLNEVIKQDIPVTIPMPEGVYHGTAKQERSTWRRKHWPWWPLTRERYSTWIDIPKGIPFQGKSENSWDCGDDGLFGTGTDGLSVEKAIGHVVASVLSSRKKYGMPSERAIKEALSA